MTVKSTSMRVALHLPAGQFPSGKGSEESAAFHLTGLAGVKTSTVSDATSLRGQDQNGKAQFYRGSLNAAYDFARKGRLCHE